jgi:hypothetical protein
MKLDLGVRRLARMWLVLGAFISTGGIVGVALAVLADKGVVRIDPSRLPTPMNLIASQLLGISLAQTTIGVISIVAAIGLFRRNPRSRTVLQGISAALIAWLLFLGGYTSLGSQRNRPENSATPLPFVVGPGVALFSAMLGFGMWALNRPAITRELQTGR